MEADILIVEDNDMVRNSLYNWLKTFFHFCNIEQAKSGEEAVRRIQDQAPGIVLMDIGLPGMNGIEATRRIKAIAPETKVVMLTFHEDVHYRDEASKSGASAYVTKGKMHKDLLPVLINLLA